MRNPLADIRWNIKYMGVTVCFAVISIHSRACHNSWIKTKFPYSFKHSFIANYDSNSIWCKPSTHDFCLKFTAICSSGNTPHPLSLMFVIWCSACLSNCVLVFESSLLAWLFEAILNLDLLCTFQKRANGSNGVLSKFACKGSQILRNTCTY